MHHSSQAAIIINDLDSLVHRIEALPAHERYTDALSLVQDAKQAMHDGTIALHDREMRQRYNV